MKRPGTDAAESPADRVLRERLAGALQARDRASASPHFARLWRTASLRAPMPRAQLRARAAWAAAAVALLGLIAVLTAQRGPSVAPYAGEALDGALARELSSPEYWRVPSDELLALAPAPLEAGLPPAAGFRMSLEESVP